MGFVYLHRIVVTLCVLLLAGVMSVAAQAQVQADGEDAILILDASGSMWGQIEGTAKIEIAKTVLDGLLDDLPASSRLGLMAYGHNKKGDCSDIEMLSPVGANRDDIKAAVKGISPKGKTPISTSVKMAAEKLKYTENKATVILISDGIETCNFDPCALGKQLEKDGVDFTAHVIGFDIVDQKTEEQLQCLASSTGGRYLSAANAGELSLALGTAIIKQVDVGPASLRLKATVLEGGPEIQSGLKWQVIQSGGGDIVFEGDDKGSVTQSVPSGVYDIFVTRSSDGLKGAAKLVKIPPGAEQAVTIALNPEFPASVTPYREQVSVGTDFSVQWEGPNRKSDFITITQPDAPARGYTSYAYTNNGNPLKLTAPTTVGDYEVRYVLANPHKVLARTPMKVVEFDTSISAKDTAEAGEHINVEWVGPNTKGDYITVTKSDAKPRAYLAYIYTQKNTSPQKLVMPVESGEYELRYVFVGPAKNARSDSHKVIATQPIIIIEAAITLDGPAQADTGAILQIPWTGPGRKRDFITVTALDASPRSYTNYSYGHQGSPAEIRMPVTPGDYELRYVQQGVHETDKVAARRPIKIVQSVATIAGPRTAKVGSEISVEWSGPAPAAGDFITITAPDAAERSYKDYAYTKNGSPAKIEMPVEPGTYELRFVQNNKKVIARQMIVVEDISVSLDAPESGKVGATISVGFMGPVAKGDWITVVPKDARAKKYNDYFYPRNGSPGALDLPKQAGDYEIRYVLDGERVVARIPISVTE